MLATGSSAFTSANDVLRTSVPSLSGVDYKLARGYVAHYSYVAARSFCPESHRTFAAQGLAARPHRHSISTDFHTPDWDGGLLQNVWLLVVTTDRQHPFQGRRFVNITAERLREIVRNQGAIGAIPQDRFSKADAAACTCLDSTEAASAKLARQHFQDGGRYVLQYLHTSLGEMVRTLPKGWEQQLSPCTPSSHPEPGVLTHMTSHAEAQVCLQHRTEAAGFATSMCLDAPSLDSFRQNVASLGAVGVVPRQMYDSNDLDAAESQIDDSLPLNAAGSQGYVLQYLTGSLLSHVWRDVSNPRVTFKQESPRVWAKQYLERLGHIITPRWWSNSSINISHETTEVSLPAVAISYWDAMKPPWRAGVAAIVESVPVATLKSVEEFVTKLTRLRLLVDARVDETEDLQGRELLPVLAAHTITADARDRHKLVIAARLCGIDIWSPNGFVLH